MTDTTNVVEDTNIQAETNETVEPTLDDLYKESGIEAVQPQIQQAQPQPQAPAPAKEEVPDPFDVDRHKDYLAKLAEETRAIKQSHDQLQQALQAERQKAFVANVESEIKQASEYVAKESGIENENLATFELNERARTDAKFKALWDGRNSSPQAKAAFTKALGVIARDIGKKYEIRTDPQLVANRKALAAARQSSATTSQEVENEPAWGSQNGVDFQANWDRLVRNNN